MIRSVSFADAQFAYDNASPYDDDVPEYLWDEAVSSVAEYLVTNPKELEALIRNSHEDMVYDEVLRRVECAKDDEAAARYD